MKTICILIISTLIASSVLMASESVKPDNCLATQSSQSRVSGKAIDSDEQENEESSSKIRSN